MKFEQFEKLVHEWSTARGIYAHSTSQAQFLKGVEEMGELASNLARGKDITDDIGDVIVCLINTAVLEQVDIEKAFDHVWDTIKNRTGGMNASGAWVKNSQ